MYGDSTRRSGGPHVEALGMYQKVGLISRNDMSDISVSCDLIPEFYKQGDWINIWSCCSPMTLKSSEIVGSSLSVIRDVREDAGSVG